MERPLKILMCAYAVDDQDVGEAHLTWHWIHNIANHADVTLITMGSRIHEHCGFETHPRVRLVLARPRIRFRWTGAFDRVIKPDYPEFYLRARKIAKQLIQTEHFDAAHHIAPHSPRYPSPLHSLGLKLLVGPIHGGLSMPALTRTGKRVFKWRGLFSLMDYLRKRYDPIMRAHFASATQLLISAPYVTASLPEQYAAKAIVIPPQPPEVLAVEPLREAENRLRLIFVGRLIESKGIRLAIKALAYVKNRNIELSVYGCGALDDELQSMVRQYQLTDIVSFKGFVKHEDVLRAFYRSDALLFPSLKEAWGLAVSEAMAAGLAVICVDRGGPGFMVNEVCGIKIPVMSEEDMCRSIAAAIDTLSADRHLTVAMGNAARTRIAEAFTWEKLIRKLLELYQPQH